MDNYSIAMQLLHVKPTRVVALAQTLSVPRLKVPRKTPKTNPFKIRLTTKNSSLILNNVGALAELHIQQLIEKQSMGLIPKKGTNFDPDLLRQAYETCRKICSVGSTTFYIGSLLMPEERKKAIWAVYAWSRVTDELVDMANTDPNISTTLDNWEKRLEDIFDGRPHDLADTALADTVQRFSLDIEPFKDLMKGMRMDLWKTRYENFQELELYCYYVAVTIGLIILPIAGISLESQPSAKCIYKAAFSSIAYQLTNILRDVAEDASRGRIYLPQDELREFGLRDKDIFSSNVTEKWREFTKMQIERAKSYYAQGDASYIEVTSRWPVWTSMMLYKKILEKIEDNN